MVLALGEDELAVHLSRQISTYAPSEAPRTGPNVVRPYVRVAIERFETCAQGLNLKGFRRNGDLFFDHLHTDQYAMFLYLVANTVFKTDGDPRIAACVYGLNKALHALDVFYEVELPGIFAFQHPVGTVLGRATYSDYLLVYQRCTVGSTLSGDAPIFDSGVVLFGGSSVVGRSRIGSNVFVSTGATLLNEVIPPNSVVFGHSPTPSIRTSSKNVVRDVFGALT
jgi:serine O-acetyltransferase